MSLDRLRSVRLGGILFELGHRRGYAHVLCSSRPSRAPVFRNDPEQGRVRWLLGGGG
jgi:hypothetical protein